MPRLRLRVASTGASYKLELPAGCTWGDLKVEARRAVGLPEDVDVLLSLNKKAPLEGPSDSSLSSLGICGGDLVWLIGPNSETLAAAGPSVAAGACGPAATATSSPSHTRVPGQNTSPAVAPPAVPQAERRRVTRQLGDAAVLRAPAAEQAVASEPTANGGSDGAGSSRASDPMEVDRRGSDGQGDGGPGCAPDGEAEGLDGAELAYPALRGVSLKLRRLLTPSGGDGSEAAGASGSVESGPCGRKCTWTSLTAAARCLLVLDCAMGEAGFLGLQDLPELASRGGAFPRQLLYGCSYITTAAAGAGRRAANDEVMGEAGGAACAAGGSGADDGGDERQALVASSPLVRLLWYSMGRYIVVHGVTCIGVGGGSAAAAGAGPASPVTLSIDLAEYGLAPSAAGDVAAPAAAATPPPSATAQQQQQQHVLQLPSDPGAHWRRLKDGLVLPLLAAACRAAGVAPPQGLLVLPLELQMTVLRVLEARDLAVLSGVCTTLHRWASEDELWQPLYDKEFGPALTPADTALASSRGYKYLYGRKWRQRAQQRKLRELFRPGPAPWGPAPLAPFVRPPYMPPGAIGGDYDRLPAPLLGGGGAGGILPGVGGGLAGGFPRPGLGLGPRRGPWGGGAGHPFGF